MKRLPVTAWPATRPDRLRADDLGARVHESHENMAAYDGLRMEPDRRVERTVTP